MARTLQGRPLITMKPPLRTALAVQGKVCDAPASAVSNSDCSISLASSSEELTEGEARESSDAQRRAAPARTGCFFLLPA